MVPVQGMRVGSLAIVALPALMFAAESAPPGDGRALWNQSLAAQRLPDLHSEVRLETTTPAGERITLSLHALGKLAPDGVNRLLMARVTAGGGSLLGTSFLSIEHLKDPDDLWLFLPALGHPK